MSATPQRETYPLVSHNDTLMMVFRDHITANARPVLYIKALVASEIRVDAAPDLDAKPAVRVVDFSKGAADTLTVVVNGGAPVVLTEGVDFIAVTSNEVTAARIAHAITAGVPNVTANYISNVAYLVGDSTVTSITISSGDIQAWVGFGYSFLGTPQTLSAKEETAIELPTGVFDPNNKVSILNVLSGKVSADLRSPIEVRTYFRMPQSLVPTTGHPGGWPVSS